MFFKYIKMILSAFVAAFGIAVFLVPNKIAAGGFSGAATLIYHYTGLPVGLTMLALNIPVLYLGYRKLGLKFIINSVICTVAMSVFLDVIPQILPIYPGDKMLACVFGGAITGAGLGFVFLSGATTGGVDIIAKLTHMKLPHLSIGRLMLFADGIIIALSALVYGTIESALYAAIAIFAQSTVIDRLIYGADKGKIYLINSKKSDEIANKILTSLNRGVTKIHATGAYSKSEIALLMCAVRPFESAHMTRLVRSVDPNAFTLTLEAKEILGLGFKTKT